MGAAHMDIHKPEPWRGWSEFVKEIGTIVIGVLIAIGAEQSVEAVHHAEQRLEMCQALDHDSQQAIDDSKSTCVFVDRLIVWQIAQIDQVRAAQAAHRPPGKPSEFNEQAFDPPTDPAFQAATSSGRISLLTPGEIAAYSEAHFETQHAGVGVENMLNADAAVRRFLFKFRRPDGLVDLSKARPAELDQYFDLLVAALGASSNYRTEVQFIWGLREALLRGERDLPALYGAERKRLSPVPAGL
jgi:hypothetical protein